MQAQEIRDQDTVTEHQLNTMDAQQGKPITYVVQVFVNGHVKARMYSKKSKADEFAKQARKVGFQYNWFTVETGSAEEKEYLAFVRKQKDDGYCSELLMDLE